MRYLPRSIHQCLKQKSRGQFTGFRLGLWFICCSFTNRPCTFINAPQGTPCILSVASDVEKNRKQFELIPKRNLEIFDTTPHRISQTQTTCRAYPSDCRTHRNETRGPNVNNVTIFITISHVVKSPTTLFCVCKNSLQQN